MTDSPTLQIDNLNKVFNTADGDVRAVDGVSFDLAPGDFVAMHGASGCGKSTLLLAAGGLLSPDAGTVTIAGQDPYTMSPEERSTFRGSNLGFVFQQFHLIPYLDVLDNILVNELATSPGEDLTEAALALLEKFKLGHRKNHIPSRLSVGEQQRVALARALVRNPKLILADEPTGNLDTENSEIILEHLAGFANEGGAVLMVTHDDNARAAAGRTLELSAGKLV